MSENVITVENLSKRYTIDHQHHKNDALRHVLERAARAPLEWMRSRRRAQAARHEDFWALRDVSLEVKQGEVLGIIGRNGAGKSTLLKILSRITEPTRGRVRIRGRVASLLEVGTGFHQDLTGRENIFLNGAILGMTSAEIRRKFDEIVSFAEIEQFLDTPVKRYSSGMYVRLAFAVAAHLEPEILLVDEVLAVGDVEFQKKCLGKMSDVAKSGRTVLFISHNMAAISRLCERGVVLEHGRKIADGEISAAVEEYLGKPSDQYWNYEAKPNGKPFQIMGVKIVSLSPSGTHISGKPLRIRVTVRSDKPIKQGCLSIHVLNYMGVSVLHFCAYDQNIFWGKSSGVNVLECELPECWLNAGPYRLSLYLSEPPGGEMFEMLLHVCPFQVEVHHATTWWGWTRDSCCYIQHEKWAITSPSRAALAGAQPAPGLQESQGRAAAAACQT